MSVHPGGFWNQLIQPVKTADLSPMRRFICAIVRLCLSYFRACHTFHPLRIAVHGPQNITVWGQSAISAKTGGADDWDSPRGEIVRR